MRIGKDKLLIIALCAAGVSSVAYGIAQDNDPVFIAGLIMIVAGYLHIRRKLKESLRNRKARDAFK
jgi:hypothetical protein